jgi:mannose-6-phosphate isomerase-like protein (cupin superfamily)
MLQSQGMKLAMDSTMSKNNYDVLDYTTMEGVPCPCGVARRGLMDVASVPYSLHVTQISQTAKTHYHKRLTETYFILECEPDAYIELDGQSVHLAPSMAIVIHPGTRHRAVGTMKVLIVASPKFDPADEWLD